MCLAMAWPWLSPGSSVRRISRSSVPRLAVHGEERVAGSRAGSGRFLDDLLALAVETRVDCGGGLVAHDLLGRQRGGVSGDAVEPFVHRVERERRDVRAPGEIERGAVRRAGLALPQRRDPDDLVVGASIRLLETGPDREVAAAIVDVADCGRVGAGVQDRNAGPAATARLHEPARI